MRTPELDELLRTLLNSGERISDLNFTPGKPPQVEIDGKLTFPFVEPPLPELTPFMTEQIALCLVNERQDLLLQLLEHGSCDCAYEVPGLARFRANVFTQRGCFSAVLRRLETRIPTPDDLALPPVFRRITQLEKGLVLLTGASGQGKSTTLAALVHEINLTRAVHVVTLEDPIEFVHKHEIGTVNQRELGTDFDTWSNGLRAAVRQAPKVIVIGELRDRDTLEAAINASDTGHLVFATMHTLGASQTLHRIVGMFQADVQERLRARLADALRYVVAQWLVPRPGGGRVAVLEVLANTKRAADLIREGESEHKSLAKVIAEGQADGMQTFDQHLAQLFEDEFVDAETVLHYCTDRASVSREMNRIRHERRAQQGGAAAVAEEIVDLKVDFTHGRTPGTRGKGGSGA
ncbi:MAG TPA: PilT/PilU family type 4a pilus ATPase [Planctomycetota bacterium]|nr:PilT/PilU family type 4a pilus ATPase [Planctomycetota bacterium]